MELTLHAARRAKTRSIGQRIIDLLMDYGMEYDAGNGRLAYFIGRRLAGAITSDATAVHIAPTANRKDSFMQRTSPGGHTSMSPRLFRGIVYSTAGIVPSVVPVPRGIR